jgi:hypothetical protein
MTAPLVTAATQNVTQTYMTTQSLHAGTIVRLDANDAAAVVPLDQEYAKDMLGVVTAVNDAPVSLTTETDQQQAYIATTGQYHVLVSTQEGAIKAGDFVTISALHGIGMKAAETDEIVIGKALQAFDGKTSIDSTAIVKTQASTGHTVSIGHILVDVTVAHNPFYKATRVDHVPTFLAKAAALISQQELGALRIYAATGTLLIVTIVAGCIIYSGVRSGIISIGRNPLARKTIMRSISQVMLVAAIVFIIGLIAVYLILKL